MQARRVLVVSNRLPLSYDAEKRQVVASSGGLVTAIRGVRWEEGQEVLWVGTVPSGIPDHAQAAFSGVDQGVRFVPVPVSDADYDAYYSGASNGALWPLLHYESPLVDFRWPQWEAYERVNQQFAETLAAVARPDDLVWIHDYQLFLLPRYLRARVPAVRIGFFLHVPFPSSEVFRQLPVREAILSSLLDADLVGFHDYSYLRHFSTSVQTLLGIESGMLSVRRGGRTVRLGVFPVSIDGPKIRAAAESPAVTARVNEHREERMCPLTVIGVDRLDYTKGIDLKLLAFREMLRQFPQLVGKVSLLQVAVPTRSDVPEYQNLRSRIEQLVGEINGAFARPHYVPVQYLYGSVDFTELLSLYRSSEALLVTSKRDGMNLVALEYLVAQPDDRPGTVLLSEFTGAGSTLSGVVPINPWDPTSTGRALGEVLIGPRTDELRANRNQRHELMIRYLMGYTATSWASSFLHELEEATKGPRLGVRAARILSPFGDWPAEIEAARTVPRRVVFVDFDGTLAPIVDRPELSEVPKEMQELLAAAAADPRNDIVVVSGRPRSFLEEQFKDYSVALAAEHGAAFRSANGRGWESLVLSDRSSWFPVARRIMDDYTARVPGSAIEEKEYGLAWHFRLAPRQFGEYQSRKLYEDLESALANFPVRIMTGKKVIEARAIEANKGSVLLWYLSQRPRGTATVLALGDDETDEDMFAALGKEGVSIRVGNEATTARFRLVEFDDVLPFLRRLFLP